jgi:hypothetical protein
VTDPSKDEVSFISQFDLSDRYRENASDANAKRESPKEPSPEKRKQIDIQVQVPQNKTKPRGITSKYLILVKSKGFFSRVIEASA